MSQVSSLRSQVSRVTLWGCSLNVIVFVFSKNLIFFPESLKFLPKIWNRAPKVWNFYQNSEIGPRRGHRLLVYIYKYIEWDQNPTDFVILVGNAKICATFGRVSHPWESPVSRESNSIARFGKMVFDPNFVFGNFFSATNCVKVI